MSAIVCGKRSLFEELAASPPVSKRIRCTSSSPVRSSPPRSQSSFPFSSQFPLLIEQLVVIFPHMDKQLLERALQECGDDLDSAIRSLNELRLGSADTTVDSTANKSDDTSEPIVLLQAQGAVTGTLGEDSSSAGPFATNAFPRDGADWVDLFVREMTSASNMDDAKARAGRALEVLEKSITARVSAEALQNFHQESMMLKEQVEALLHENNILKRAVAIQHERQKESEGRNQELQHLKQLVAQYQEQLRALEVNNYALTMHLKQAQQSNSIPGRFNPDVF